jgi:hypothetical protein
MTNQKLCLLVFFLINLLWGCGVTKAKDTEQTKAELIYQRYESQFLSLSRKAQHHYALRMYRLTGENRYAQQTINEVYQINDRLNYYLEHLQDQAFRLQQAQQLIDSLPDTKRGRLRRQALTNTGEQRFALYLLYQLARLDEYGLRHAGHQQFIRFIKQSKLAALLLSEEFIYAYAAQVANYVAWLAQLGIADIQEPLVTAFQAAYPDVQDASLSASQFNNKLYGLTHMILAASHYYQHPVETERYRWITDYFSANLKLILATKADIQAEVGLCFLLTGQQNHPALVKLRQAVAAKVDPQQQMVLSTRGNADLSLGEHRNVLAYALLNWPQRLYAGPKLLENNRWKAQLPLVYRQ